VYVIICLFEVAIFNLINIWTLFTLKNIK